MFVELKGVVKQKYTWTKKYFTDKYKDVFNKTYKFTRAKTAKAFGYYPYYLDIRETEGTNVLIGNKKAIMLGSNNYLGLTHHPEVIEAGVRALKKYGSGLTGSRLLNGNIYLHNQLEERLASFVGKEKALVFSTGFAVNLGVISTITDEKDAIFSDEMNHASIVDGARFSKAPVLVFGHNDMNQLEDKLISTPKEYGRLIVSDGIFSMEGDIVKLPEMVKIARKYGARIMIDDAHSLGVLGPNGDGTAAHYNLTDKVDLIMGTFSKSLAGIGGFIAGEEPVIDYLKHHTRTIIFTAGLPPANTATVLKALEIIIREPERRAQLWNNANHMKKELSLLGFNIGNSSTPVIPVIIGDEMKTFSVWRDLLDAGVYTNPIISPAVPSDRSLLRTSYMATHTREQLDFCLEQFAKVGKKQRVIRPN
ncbi:aminotransferase class I/II-fold pyridoxal phosphate-dependent enzyme [bacterium]|nr:aminotransferase class I/II-fold pyridoxal phosphate-dependent enzyme [bacterium]